MVKLKNKLVSILLLSTIVLLHGCASTEELFAEYDDKFCVVPEHPDRTFRWEPVVYFDSDSSLVRAGSMGKLKANIDTLAKLPGYKVSLKGFTDHQASEDYNAALSNRRVEAVRTLLVKEFGLETDRIIGSSHGESSPLTSNFVSPVDVDRRVEMLLLSPDLEPVVNQPLIRAQQ